MRVLMQRFPVRAVTATRNIFSIITFVQIQQHQHQHQLTSQQNVINTKVPLTTPLYQLQQQKQRQQLKASVQLLLTLNLHLFIIPLLSLRLLHIVHHRGDHRNRQNLQLKQQNKKEKQNI